MKFRGLSPKLPLTRDSEDGYSLNKTYREMVKQNVRMLLFTAPGERIMDPNFGVGLKTYLFENMHSALYGNIESKIRKQISTYMPFIRVIELNFYDSQADGISNENYLKIEFKYLIKPLNEIDAIDLDFDFNEELLI
jgi:hypothetical protein